MVDGEGGVLCFYGVGVGVHHCVEDLAYGGVGVQGRKSTDSNINQKELEYY